MSLNLIPELKRRIPTEDEVKNSDEYKNSDDAGKKKLLEELKPVEKRTWEWLETLLTQSKSLSNPMQNVS